MWNISIDLMNKVQRGGISATISSAIYTVPDKAPLKNLHLHLDHRDLSGFAIIP